jgi:hypothetical protein
MVPVTLTPDLRFGHWYIIGASGSGKTTFLTNILLEDIRRGLGFCFIDLHGDAPYELLGNIPQNRLKDVIYYDPTTPFTPAFNVLKLPYPPDKIAGDLTALFKMFSEGSWGPRLADILTTSLSTLLYDMRDNDRPRTLLDLRYFLVDEDFRHEIIRSIKRPAIQEFWKLDYPKLDRDMVSPVLNKLREFLAPESIARRVFSEPDNEIDFREIMDKKKILLVRLARGKIGDEAARVLGSVFIRGVQQAALSREDIPENSRIPFFLVVDEFENFAPEPFESILAETRKYKVFLTLAHQGLHQTTQKLKHSVFTNCKVYFTFQIPDSDAHELVREMPGSRSTYRVREQGTWKPISNFITYARGLLAETYQEAEANFKRLDAMTSVTETQLTERGHYRKLSRETASAYHALKNPDIGVSALSEIAHKTYGVIPVWRDFLWDKPHQHKGVRLFPDIEFREDPYPSVQQLVKLPPFAAFCRVKGVADPFLIEKTRPAPRPVESIRQAILNEHQRRYNERVARQQATVPTNEPSQGTNEQPNTRQRTATNGIKSAGTPPRGKSKKPKTDEDFLN